MGVNADPKSTWKANECLLTPENPKFDKTLCKHTNRQSSQKAASHAQQQRSQGMVSLAHQEEQEEDRQPAYHGAERFVSRVQSQQQEQAFREVRKWRMIYERAEEIPNTELPKSFDLRNVSGIDFTSPPRSQGFCSSCYAFSFVQALETRLRIKYGKLTPLLSVQQLLSCNYLSEGCEGGWDVLIGYFAENAGVATEECAKYQKVTGECSQFEKCPMVARVSSTRQLTNPTE